MIFFCESCGVEVKIPFKNYKNQKYCENCKFKSNNKIRREQTRSWRDKIHMIALTEYGWKCQECGCNDVRVLEWHHTNGRKHDTPDKLVVRIKKHGRQSDIELLCANCHILADLRDGTNKKGKRNIRVFNKFLVSHQEI